MSTEVTDAQVDSDYREVDESSFDLTPEDSVAKLISTDRVHSPDAMPSPKALELLSIWQAEEAGADDPFDWRTEYDRQLQENTIILGDEIHEPMNDAEVLGSDHPDLEEFLQQELVFMTGELYDQGDRRNTRDGKWSRTVMSVYQWLEGGDGWGLTKHPVSKTKQGASIVPSENLNGQRKDAAVKTMYAVGIDIDSGSTLEEVKANLLEAGYFCLIYTTFNHRKTHMELKHDDVVRKLQLDGTPNRVQVQEYLRLHHKDRCDRDFIANIEVTDFRKHTAEGLRIVLKTPPIDKFRVIFPLAQPVELADLATTMNEWKGVWADAVSGVALNICGADFDASSCDVNRLFYTPRHAKGAEWYSAVILGKPLSFDEIEPASKDKYVRDRKAIGDPFAVGDAAGPGDVAVYLTPSGKSLNEWHRKRKHLFEMANVIETYCPDKIRPASDKPGTVTIECPFEHEHSSTGGTGTLVMNPDANIEGYWSIFCRHDACTGRHKLEFLQEMLAQEWFPEEVLFDDTFLLPMSDEEMAAQTGADITAKSKDDDLKAHFKPLVEAKDTSTIADEVLRISKFHPLGKRGLNNIVSAVKAEAASRDRALEKAKRKSTAIDVSAGFNETLAATKKRLCQLNAKEPILFEFHEKLACVRKRKDGRKVFKLLDKVEALREFLAREVGYEQPTISGDNFKTVSIAPQKEIASNLLESDLSEIAMPLKRFAEVPFVVPDGIVVDDGYHEGAQTYLATQSGLVLPCVSREPSEEEVERALRLLLEPFCDFPLDEVSRKNLIGLLLLLFGRDLIDGPIPAHLINKPSRGEGSGLVVDILAEIWTGKPATAMEYPSDKAEVSKTLIAKLRSGTSYLLFDNVAVNIDSTLLCTALTQGEVDARVFGKNDGSAVDPVEMRVPMIFTGINVTMNDEMPRRTVLISLDSGEAHPEERTGPEPGKVWRHPDVLAWVREHRAELIWAALTLIQNWIAKGRKTFTPKKPRGKFENWQNVIGGILRDAGLEGHDTNRDELIKKTKSVKDDALKRINDVLADFDPGTVFYTGQRDDKCGVTDLLLEHNIHIHTWGYSDDGMSYNTSKVGAQFKKHATRPHRARKLVGEAAIDVEVSFEQGEDAHEKINNYRMQMRLPGEPWCSDMEAWEGQLASKTPTEKEGAAV
ncbi:MAG: hypothetical protein AAGF68_00690 [Pseudomonadota bacterium]